MSNSPPIKLTIGQDERKLTELLAVYGPEEKRLLLSIGFRTAILNKLGFGELNKGFIESITDTIEKLAHNLGERYDRDIKMALGLTKLSPEQQILMHGIITFDEENDGGADDLTQRAVDLLNGGPEDPNAAAIEAIAIVLGGQPGTPENREELKAENRSTNPPKAVQRAQFAPPF